MKAMIEKRLKELEHEFELGQKILAETEEKSSNLRNSLLKISGAVQELQDIIRELEEGESLAKEE